VTFAEGKAVVTQPSYSYDLKNYTQSYQCGVNEFLLRKLGGASRASVRVPTRNGNVDHQYTATELRRFKLFAENVLPTESLIK
jgi:hypothetical protein